MNERLKLLRRHMDLTQQEFADKIGMKRNTIANYETNRNEPSNSVISLICKEFNVNEKWLRTGDGEMFLTLPPEDEYLRAATEISKSEDDEIIRKIIIEYWKLNPDGKKLLKDFIKNISKNVNEAKS